MSVKTAATTDPTRSAETPTKVFQLVIERTRTRTYFVTVAAESAEQAKAGWDVNQYEYDANDVPHYRDDETSEACVEVVETPDFNVEDVEVSFGEVCNALELPYEGEED